MCAIILSIFIRYKRSFTYLSVDLILKISVGIYLLAPHKYLKFGNLFKFLNFAVTTKEKDLTMD